MDIKSGVEKFCEKYGTVATYDIKHKGAAILKRDLRKEPCRKEFSKQAGKTSKRVQQTALSGMAPPNKRSKARYMNADRLVDWGVDILAPFSTSKKRAGEKFGWACAYRDRLRDWKSLVDIVKTATSFVNFMRLYKGIDEDLRDVLYELPPNCRFFHIEEELEFSENSAGLLVPSMF